MTSDIFNKYEQVEELLLEEGTTKETLEQVLELTTKLLVGITVGHAMKVPSEVLKEYIEESAHNNWDGWSVPQLLGLQGALEDLVLYKDAATLP